VAVDIRNTASRDAAVVGIGSSSSSREDDVARDVRDDVSRRLGRRETRAVGVERACDDAMDAIV
jgi:hypothetical protein